MQATLSKAMPTTIKTTKQLAHNFETNREIGFILLCLNFTLPLKLEHFNTVNLETHHEFDMSF